MNKRMLLTANLLAALSLLPTNTHALSPEATEGKALFAVCDACHNPTLDPPQGPPMWGVQRRYKMESESQDDFIARVADFVASPSVDKAILVRAVDTLGLMPAMALPEDNLKKVAAYLWEAKFPPPCDHWKIGLKRAEAAGDAAHAAKERRQLKRFCGQ